MTSNKHHSLYIPSPQNNQNDFKLPSLKDLNFYRPQGTSAVSAQQEQPPSNPQHEYPPTARHGVQPSSTWQRPHQSQQQSAHHPSQNHLTQQQHQQHSPPLSAAHDSASLTSSRVEYTQRHENNTYAHPGIPLSAQTTPIPGSVTSRSEDATHSPNQPKRTRTAPSGVPTSRDGRTPVNYNTQYVPYTQVSQPTASSPYPTISSGLSGPPVHAPQPQATSAPPVPPATQPSPDQLQYQPMPVTASANYPSHQQQQYMSRPPVIHQQQQHPQSHPVHQSQQNPSNPYPSPGPPPPAPPPQGPWAPPQPAHPQHQQHQLPPPPSQTPQHHQQHQQHQPQHQQQHQHQHQHQQHQHQPQHPPQQHVPAHQQPQAQQPPLPPAPSHISHQQHAPPHPPPPSQPSHHSQQPQQHVPQSSHPQHHPSHPPQSQPQHPPPQHYQQPPPPQHHQPAPPPPPQHHQPPPPPPPVQQQPPPQHQQQQQQQQQPHHQQHQMPYVRTTSIVPTMVDTRPPQSYPAPSEPQRNDTMAEITHRCSVLYQFASRWVQLQSTSPQMQPTHSELKEMSDLAMEVVRLLEQLRAATNTQEAEQSRIPQDVVMQGSPDSARPPKRPWEDISEDDPSSMSDPNGFNDSPQQQPQQQPGQQQPYPSSDKPQTTAEQDMELIRTKRATSTAGANGNAGQQKSKYRKRSRATPPGKCHSCNIRETPEWRRGPDGARTLCNACGLHYAKLMRKRDKAGPNGEPQHIDLETLRASARAAETADKASRSNKQSSSRSHQPEPASPMDSVKQTPQQHHQGSFQLVNVMAPDPNSSSSIPTPQQQPAQLPPPPPPPPQQQQQSQPPPPAPTSIPPNQTQWATAPPPGRMYPPNDHLQHQSFMRTSQHGSR